VKKRRYVIDANSLIQAWRSYPENHFSDLWERLEHLMTTDRLNSPELVGDELDAGDDALKKWVKQRNGFFKAIDEEQQQLLSAATRAFPSLGKSPGRKNLADPWVVVLAQQLSATVITEEKGKGYGPGSVKIPDVCKHFNLLHGRFTGLFAAENWSFRLHQ
jgi:hypothetical protein